MNRSYYSNTISNFVKDTDNNVLGKLIRNHSHSLEDLQRNSWIFQIEFLHDILTRYDGYIFFEFSIPRMGKRVDNILIINNLIFVIEFKIGANNYDQSSISQVIDYTLDLKNFHQGSHDSKLIPILVSTDAPSFENNQIFYTDGLSSHLLANISNLKSIIDQCLLMASDEEINGYEWENSIYKPTPTIVEAAQALYKGHNVKEISRSDSGAKNLSITSDCISDIIENSKLHNRKSICFVTGVPGAGKTLAGLNIASDRNKVATDENSVFLSGNGPLVEVLREALARDKVLEAKEHNRKLLKSQASSEVRSFIQNIHHFRDDALISNKPPVEKVAVFDEAQRAWDKTQTTKFMKQKKGMIDFKKSEPEFLIEVMDRHNDWCVIICLIGGGQEINTGEAGLEEWMSAIEKMFKHWDIYISEEIYSNRNYLSDVSIISKTKKLNVIEKKDLHLSVSVRSFRSEKISDFVQNVIELDIKKAKELYQFFIITIPLYSQEILKKLNLG